MKVLIVGDLHFRQTLPYSAAFEDGRSGEWGDMIRTITEAAKEADSVVLMGDNLNSKNNSSGVIRDFVEFLKGFGDKPVHILVGNHERSGFTTALDFLERIDYPNWHVYTTPTQRVNLGEGVSASFIPYMTAAMVVEENDKDAVEVFMDSLVEADLAFFHQGITGAVTHGSMVDLFNEMVFPREKLESLYGNIFSGHIHQEGKVGDKIQMTGSVFSMEVGDHEKHVFLHNTKTKKTKPVALPVRGIYHVENPKDVKDIPKSSIVKCTLTDKAIKVTDIKEMLSVFDAHMLLEKYPSERQKLHFEDTSIDLSLDSLLKVYAKAKDLRYTDLIEGLTLLKINENSGA